ncbi:MAG: hypothetical protein DRP78_06455 [Candidatus Omnitrophota bacterium]|nr:MAG: hypothetical protein DRP78_06455 [Candidatus Omnitrophota bacterium]
MRSYRKGLSLIEFLVTMGILTLIVFTLHMVFDISLTGWKKADNFLQATEIARVTLERISREISSADFQCLGFDGPSGYRSDSIGDEFYFIAPLKYGNSEGTELCEVGYWLDGKGTDTYADDVLKRFYVTDKRKIAGKTEIDLDFATGRSNELATNVTKLEFLYYDKIGAIHKSWSASTLPAKIKVTIGVSVGKDNKLTSPDQDFSVVIALP